MNFLDEPKHCQFCNKEMRRLHPRNNSYNCDHGERDNTHLSLTYHWDQNLKLTTLTFILGERASPWVWYHISLFPVGQRTLVTHFPGNDKEPYILFCVERLLEINPDNVREQLNRFKKLRVYL